MNKLYTNVNIFIKHTHLKKASTSFAFSNSGISHFMKKNYSILLLACLLFLGGNGFGQIFKQITVIGDLTNEQYLIVGDHATTTDGLMLNTVTAATPYINYSAISNPGATISTGYTSANIFDIVLSGGVITIYNSSIGYASWGRTGNIGNTATFYSGAVANTEQWTPTVASGLWTLANVNTAARLLQWNSASPRFACYTSTQTKFKLYKKAYTVTYLGNSNTGGTAPTDASSPYFSGATVTVKANTGTLVRTGYTFSGWNTKADGSGTDYAATGSVTYTKIAVNDTFYAKWTSAAASYSGVSTGAGTEPATLPSTTTALSGASAPQTNAILNYDFLVTDDANTTSGNDALPTLITNIVIPQGTGNDIADWTQAIQGAELSDGTNTITGTVNATNLTFASIPTGSGTLGNIGDGSSKTYTLKIWLKTALGGTLPTTIDGLNLAFKIDRTNFTTASSATSTQFESGAGTAVESGSTNNAIAVVATKLNFVQQPTNVNQNATMSPSVTISANDPNGNRDLNYTANILLASTGTMTGAPITVAATSGLATYSGIVHTVAGTGLVLTGTSGALTATGNSSAFNVIALTPVINVTSQAHNSTYAYGSVVWGNTLDQTFTINNTGSAVMTISSLTFGGSGFAIQGATPTTVAIGGTATFTVRFTPNAIGAFTGSVTINNNSSNQTAYVINFTGTGTPSNLSTITTDASYSYTTNILYANFQTTPVPASSANSVGVHNIIITDGVDADNLPTILSTLNYTYSGTANTVRAAALFTTTNTKIADATTITANGIAFTGLSGVNVTAADGGTVQMILRVTFTTTVTDNQKLIFTVSGATAAASNTSSLFTSYGAVSDNSGANDKNRIEVVATKLAFIQQPTSTTNGATMSPAVTVRGDDANNNTDLDFATNVSVVCSTPAALTAGSGPVSPASGIATFSSIVHGTDGTYTMTASATGLTNAVSNSYTISTFTYLPGDFRPLYATDLSYNGTWEYYNGSAWVAVPDGKAPENTTTTIGRVIINDYVSGGGSTSKAYNCDFIIQSGGELDLVANDAPPIAAEMIAAGKKLEVLNGGILTVQGDIDIASTGNLIVRSGAQMTLNQNTINNVHPIWDGVELFEGGSTVTIKDWDFSASAINASLINVSTAITNNANGWKFGKLVYDVNTGTNNWAIIGGGIGIINLTENNFVISNAAAPQYYITGATNKTGTNGFIVNDSMIINNGSFAFGSSYSADPFSHQFTVNGNFEYNGDDTLRTHYIGNSNPTTLTGFVNFKKNVTIASTAKLFASYKATTNNSVVGINLNGTGVPVQELTIYPNVVAVPITIKSGTSVLQKLTDITVNSLTSVTSAFTIEKNATYNFGFDNAGTTALVIKLAGSSAGTSRFVTDSLCTLKITHMNGLSNSTAFSASGNVQGISTSNRSINPLATFWYIAKPTSSGSPAYTGNAMGNASNGRQIIIDLGTQNTAPAPPSNAIYLQGGTIGLSNSTSISPTGGKLDIRNGHFYESTTDYISSSSGTLYMAIRTGYYVYKGNATAAASYSDLIPRMEGVSYPYNLAGGQITLWGATSGNYYQTLRGGRTYPTINFAGGSGSDYQSISSNVTIDSSLNIGISYRLEGTSNINGTSGTTIVDCIDASGNPVAFQGNGGLYMVSGRLRIKMLNTPSPELTANNPNTTYALTGGTIEFYGSGATQQQQIRGNYRTASPLIINYYNIDINAAAANLQTFSTTPTAVNLQSVGNVDMNSSFSLTGTLNVNKPAVFRMDASDFIYDGSFVGPRTININAGAGLLYGNEFGIKTSGTGVSDGNIRTSGTRTFSTTANYGFVSNGSMVSGNGLPSSVAGLYAYRTNSSDVTILNNGGTLITGTGSSNYNVGRQAAVTGPSNFSTLSNSGLAFNVTTAFVLNSVDVYNTNAGTFQIQLLDNSGSVLLTSGTFTLPLSSGTTPTTCNLGWTIPVGTGYKLVAASGGTTQLGRDAASSYPYSLGAFGSITSGWIVGSGASASSYFYFYNWGISLGILGLQNGKIESSSSNKLVMDVPLLAGILSPVNVGSVNNMGYQNSYVIGLMGRKSNATTQLVFPIGSSSIYGPLSLTPQNSTTQTYSCDYTSTGYGTYTLDPANSPQLDHVSKVEWWNVTSTASGSNDDAKVKLFWRTHSQVSAVNTDWSNLRVAHFDATDWNTEGNSPTITGSVTTWGSVESDIYVPNFSPITIATITSNNPLPVELSRFVGNCNGDFVQLDWTTLSEKNSKLFIVERSSDGVNFVNIGNVNAAGYSTTIKDYTFIDSTSSTDNYYRLVELDNDNTQQTSVIIKVSCDGVNGTTIFYTPTNGVEVETYSTASKELLFNVYEVSGKLLHQETKQVQQGYSKFSLDIRKKLANGIYLIQQIDGTKSTSTKVWIH